MFAGLETCPISDSEVMRLLAEGTMGSSKFLEDSRIMKDFLLLSCG